MPRKKQVTFQPSLEGKFIPRKSSPSTSVFPLGATDNRFNSKMVEIFNSSATISDENPAEKSKIVPTNFLRQQIVTKTIDDKYSLTTRSILKSQPITFGQLRETTNSTKKTSIDVDENLGETKKNSSTSVEEILSKFYVHSVSSPSVNSSTLKVDRPPPPSYSSSVAKTFRQNSIVDVSTQSLSNLSFNSENSSTRPPPPRYQSPSSSCSPPNKSVNSTTFDHKFSRFLYGKRRSRTKRKALSDPVKFVEKIFDEFFR